MSRKIGGEKSKRGSRRWWGALAIVCCGHAGVVSAQQFSQPLFLELVRDPGQVDTAKTARSLALAGVPLISGGADEAVSSPAGLVLGNGTDAVASFGFFSYARNELLTTPNQAPPFDQTRRLSATSTVPIGFVAVATRRTGWAAAGFYDASSRVDHAFATEKAELFSAALFPTILIETGSGAASLSHSVVRAGGSVAFGTPRAAVGVSAYLVRLNYTADALDTIEIRSSSFANPVLTTFCCVTDEVRVEIHDQSVGLAISGLFAPTRHLTIAGRWRHEPAFDALRVLTMINPRATPVAPLRQDVRLALPAAYGVSAIVTAAATTIAADVTRELYGGVFSPLMSPVFDPNYVCGRLTAAACPGWNFPYHETADITTVKLGVEQRLTAGPGRLVLRGGVAYEPGYTLARSATDPSTGRGRSLPAPSVVTELEPPREAATWFSGGVAYAWRALEIGAGVGHAVDRTRVLAEVRWRLWS